MEVTTTWDPGAWDAYVAEHPDTYIFHTTAWRDVIREAFGHQTYYLAGIDDQGVRGVLPLVQLKSLFFGNLLCSLPFVTTGGVCADNDTVKNELISEAIRLGQKLGVGHIEFRQTSDEIANLETRDHKVAMRLPLTSTTKEMFGSFRSEIRNRIRKAERGGLEAEICGREGLDDFYQCYRVNMRDLGTPVYAQEFFEAQFAQLGEQVRIVRVRENGSVAGAGIMVFYRDRVEMPWVAAMRKYFKLAPNNLLYWHAMKYSIERGAREFDFGRSTRGSGTYTFKKRWGAIPEQLRWQYWTPSGERAPQLDPDNPRYQLAIRTWQRLPVPVTAVIGPRLGRHLP